MSTQRLKIGETHYIKLVNGWHKVIPAVLGPIYASLSDWEKKAVKDALQKKEGKS